MPAWQREKVPCASLPAHLLHMQTYFDMHRPRCDSIFPRASFYLSLAAGSISAEHGIGQLKVSYLQTGKAAAELGLMRAIKNTLDPKNTFNPGKVIP
jgi:FAD/FMN-containing dehydrogenase